MKQNFSWELFDSAFLQSICYSEKTKKTLRPRFETSDKDSLLPYIDSICPVPNAHFVRRYHTEILDHFFAGSTHLVSLIRALEKRHYRGVRVGNMDDMLLQAKRLRLTSTVLTLILSELYRAGSTRITEDSEVSIFTTPKEIDLTACIPDDLSMYDYQTDAVQALHHHFIEDNHSAGVLVMPTGSGKTRVATRFLLESMVAQGWQVIWLTHRAMLIEQTASSVYQTAGALLRSAAPSKDRFKMICVSGSHASVKATEKDDDVMICGVQSLVRNLPYLPAVLRDRVLVVIDEAHHAVAPSYRLILNEIRKLASQVKVLGLTATPVRATDTGTEQLMRLFNNEIIYSVPMSPLIAKGYLSEPHYEKVETNIDFATTITLDERRYIQKWGELSPDTMERMARITERNALIADTYMKNRERYGKTLIFALNATHCISLCEELQKRGVRCDYIYCAHPGNAEKTARFQRGELDVLVNIQVLTEGSDVPDIQTVFLTRPTTSDVLLMQMIGRGMRGTGSGGTATVNIVDFHDVWGNFTAWLNPQFILAGEKEPDDSCVQSASRKESVLIPWAMIRDLLDGINTTYLHDNEVYATLPIGWYDVLDEDGLDSKVLVFESQLAGYLAMFKDKANTLDQSHYSGIDALEDYFDGFGILPSARDIQLVLDSYRMSGEFPHLHHISQRNKIDAAVLAEKLKCQNVGIADLNAKILETYREESALIDSIYGGQDAYCKRVMEFILYPKGIRPLGMKIEEIEVETLTLDSEPFYDLDELVAEVIDERFDGAYGPLPPVRWTKRPYSSYFGMYTYSQQGDFIRINCVLNSRSVPREALKYVIYHELLHRDIRVHNAAFRALEHQYPCWTEHERFLDVTFPKFDLDCAL